MNGLGRKIGLAMVAALGLMTMNASCVKAQDQQAGQQAGQQPYGQAEYNAEQACAAEKNPQAQVKCLDDFVSKFPNSALLTYIYPMYVEAYRQLKDYPKEIEYADKVLGLGDKIDALVRYQVYSARAYAYNNLTAPTPDQATKARQAALDGLKSLDVLKKPDAVSDADFSNLKKQSVILFNFTAATASMTLKDCSGAVGSFKAVLAQTPDDAITNYKIGQAYLCENPPQQMDAFWYFARASSKDANAQEAGNVKTYLRKLIVNYQGGTVCDNLTDAELNELLQLASTSADRPATYTLVTATDLNNARQNMTIASVIADLKGGGDKAKTTWLAVCGSEFPDVPGKLLDINTSGAPSSIELKEAFVTSEAEFDAAKVPDMDIKVVDQPDAARLEKDNAVRFTGTLVSYDPDPFTLHWDKAKVNVEDIPKEKEKTPTRRRPGK